MRITHPKPAVSGVKNDIQETSKTQTLHTLSENAHPTTSFFLVLVCSALITTLGLLLNNSPVIIGGMIIAPLMWPLMHLSLGISTGKLPSIRSGIGLLVFATVLASAVAALTTTLSPLKQIDTEIIARTSPTLLDMVVALAAGIVATLALTHPKVSESLAGVAVATSLLPPLCVTGIAISLQNLELFTGSLLLFGTNVASILFISTLMFWWIGYKTRKQVVVETGLVATALILVLLSIPLFDLLRNQSFELGAYTTAQRELTQTLEQISPEAEIDTLSTTLSPDGKTLTIAAQVFLPAESTIDYSQQQQMSQDLEKALSKRVDLQLQLQPTISVVSSSDLETIRAKSLMEQALKAWLLSENVQAELHDFNASQVDSVWIVGATLLGDPQSPPTIDTFGLEQLLQQTVKQPVRLSLAVSPHYALTPSGIHEQRVQASVRSFFAGADRLEIEQVRVQSTAASPGGLLVEVQANGPRNTLTGAQVRNLSQQLEAELQQLVTVSVQFTETLVFESE